MSSKKRGLDIKLTMLAGIILIISSSSFILSLFFPIRDSAIDNLRIELGENGFRLFQIRMIVASMVSGIMLILLSIVMDKNPKELTHFGTMTIIVSVISILGIGLIYPLSIIAALIGVAGGVIAILHGKKGVTQIKQDVHKEVSNLDVDYVCTKCNLKFNTDNELKTHMINHLKG